MRRLSVKTKRVTVPIYGLGCGGGGSLTVERALVKIPGIVRTYVNPAMEMAYVEYDPARTDPRQWIEPVERVGFRAGDPQER
jgi:copper chaperone CopZ